MLFMQGNRIQVWGRQTSQANHGIVQATTTTTILGEKASPVYPGKYLFPICFIVFKFAFYVLKKLKTK